VHDLARAAVIYEETPGLKHLFTAPPKMAFFDCDGIRLMLAIPERPDLDHPSSVLYFKVADVKHAHKSFDITRSPFRNQANAGRADGRRTIFGSPNLPIRKTMFSRSCTKNPKRRKVERWIR